MKRMPLWSAVLLVLAPLAVPGCGSSNDKAHVKVLLTDAPADLVDSALVTVSRVYLVGEGADTASAASRVDLMPPEESPRTFDLMQLEAGTESLVGEADVPEGTYSQLRLVVDRARVVLVPGAVFDDGTSSRELSIPSGSRSGIKVQLVSAIDAASGKDVTVVVDFNVDDNFVLQGNPDTPAGLKGILFTPVLKEKERTTQTSSARPL